jgi:hypothetical protein
VLSLYTFTELGMLPLVRQRGRTVLSKANSPSVVQCGQTRTMFGKGFRPRTETRYIYLFSGFVGVVSGTCDVVLVRHTDNIYNGCAYTGVYIFHDLAKKLQNPPAPRASA